MGDLVAGHGEQAAGRGGHRRKTGADNGEPHRRKEKEMEKRVMDSCEGIYHGVENEETYL